jgi:hypothetical protein
VCSRSSLHPRGTHHHTPHEAVSHNLTGRFLAVPRAASCFGPPTARDTPDCTHHSTLAHAHRHTATPVPRTSDLAISHTQILNRSEHINMSSYGLRSAVLLPMLLCGAVMGSGGSIKWVHAPCVYTARITRKHARTRTQPILDTIRSPYSPHAPAHIQTACPKSRKTNPPHHLPSSTTRCQVQHRFWSGANVRQE